MSAKIRLYIPFTPVPVTGQVFAVLLCGVFLGKEFGPLSQVFYLLFGLFGVPWFVIGPLGPTGGYLIGFIFAPFIIGFLREKLHDSVPTTLLAMLTGIFIIYLFGLIQFSIFTQSSMLRSIRLAVLPFIPFDVGKALIATFVSQILLRKLRALPL
jgi:biotin transport system substrate-specific component